MAATTSLRFRRTEAQLHALACVEREIRCTDHNGRRKYLQAFNNAFRSYDSVITPTEFRDALAAVGTVLIGDYHALPAAQRFAAGLLEQRSQPGDRPVVLGLETIFSRDQHIVNEWWRREIDEKEFRDRIRFDLDWGYDWAPFYELLVTAREHADAIYGLDCMPREDLRKIAARDRHAAHKIAEIRQNHPNAAIMVLFGESHLAPGHLPTALREQLPEEQVLTVLQNVDALYWKAAGEVEQPVEAVRVNESVLCAFNSTPLEKYENYRLHLSRWGRTDEEGPDLTPTVYNLIDGLVRFLDINRYSSHNSTQPKFLVDMLPEVYGHHSEARLRRILSRYAVSEAESLAMARQVEDRGSIYLPQANALYIRDFQMMYVAEEATRFLHHACRGLPMRDCSHDKGLSGTDLFYTRMIEHALAYLGSRVLYSARASGVDIEHELSRASCDRRAAKASSDENSDAFSMQMGYSLGSHLYEAYVAGVMSRTSLRHLFLTHLDAPGRARSVCHALLAEMRPHAKKPS